MDGSCGDGGLAAGDADLIEALHDVSGSVKTLHIRHLMRIDGNASLTGERTSQRQKKVRIAAGAQRRIEGVEPEARARTRFG